MSATATVNSRNLKGIMLAGCTVSDSDTRQTHGISVCVAPGTWQAIPPEHQDMYLQARALLSAGPGYPADALDLVKPLATGEAATGKGPSRTKDTRNWAALWVDGRIPC